MRSRRNNENNPQRRPSCKISIFCWLPSARFIFTFNFCPAKIEECFSLFTKSSQSIIIILGNSFRGTRFFTDKLVLNNFDVCSTISSTTTVYRSTCTTLSWWSDKLHYSSKDISMPLLPGRRLIFSQSQCSVLFEWDRMVYLALAKYSTVQCVCLWLP